MRTTALRIRSIKNCANLKFTYLQQGCQQNVMRGQSSLLGTNRSGGPARGLTTRLFCERELRVSEGDDEVGYLRRNLVCSTATLVQKVSGKWREEEKEGNEKRVDMLLWVTFIRGE